MELSDIIKLIIFAAVFILPPILKAAEQNKKGAQPPRRNPQQGKRPAPRTGQTLSEWIEEVRRVSEGKEAPQAESRPSPTPPPVRDEELVVERIDDSVVPVKPHVHPVEVDIEAHVNPVRPEIRARVSPVHSRFDVARAEEKESKSRSLERDSARRAKGAKRESTKKRKAARASRVTESGRASIRVRRGDLKRAIIMREILSPPLALRSDEDGLV